MAERKEEKKISIPKKELVQEHKHLVSVLESPSHKDDIAEATKQRKELKGYTKKADPLASELTSEKGVSESGIEARRADPKQKGLVSHGYARITSPEKHGERAKNYFRQTLNKLKAQAKPNLPKSEEAMEKSTALERYLKAKGKSKWEARAKRSAGTPKGVHTPTKVKGGNSEAGDFAIGRKVPANDYDFSPNRTAGKEKARSLHANKLKELRNMPKPNLPKSEYEDIDNDGKNDAQESHGQINRKKADLNQDGKITHKEAVKASSMKKEELDKKDRCWDGYKPVPGKKPYEKGSCAPIEKSEEVPCTCGAEDIKKDEKPFHGYNKEKHSKSGGLNDKYRKKYNRETGSNLQRPSKDKDNSRHKSFCARMSGVKGPTSKEGKLTPKGAALKRWNCSKNDDAKNLTKDESAATAVAPKIWSIKHQPTEQGGFVHFSHPQHGTVTIKKNPRPGLATENPYVAVHNGAPVGRYKDIHTAVHGVKNYVSTLGKQTNTRMINRPVAKSEYFKLKLESLKKAGWGFGLGGTWGFHTINNDESSNRFGKDDQDPKVWPEDHPDYRHHSKNATPYTGAGVTRNSRGGASVSVGSRGHYIDADQVPHIINALTRGKKATVESKGFGRKAEYGPEHLEEFKKVFSKKTEGLGKSEKLKKDEGSSSYVDGYLNKMDKSLKTFLLHKDRNVDSIVNSALNKGQKEKALHKLKSQEKYLRRGYEFSKFVKDSKNSQTGPQIKTGTLSGAKYKDRPIPKFGIVAGHTCPQKGNCFGTCYALQGQYDMNKNLITNNVNNWAAAERDDFVPKMSEHISKTVHPGSLFRIHDSGDFYSQDYLDKWRDIAKNHPDKTFYAYTKSLNLNFDDIDKLPNFKIIRSIGGQQDDKIDPSKPHAVIFPNIEELHKNGYTYVGDNDALAADPNVTKIGLVHHGTKGRDFHPNIYSHLGINLADTKVRKAPKADKKPKLKQESSPSFDVKLIKNEIANNQESLSGHTLDQPDLMNRLMDDYKLNNYFKAKLAKNPNLK
jgi:hypothetical protein